MAYINLNRIGELADESALLKHMAECACYNTDEKKDRLTDYDFVAMIKTHKQAQNLLTKLKKMHQVCTDLATGNIQPYIDEFEKWKESDADAFDVWEELERCFNTFSVDDLPQHIEQYSELLNYSRHFAELQKAKRVGLEQFFGTMPRYYQGVDEEGQPVMIPESEMPTDVLHQRDVRNEIAEVEVEYCLDNYNEFYQIASGIYGSYAGASDDTAPCAEAILSLFGPYPVAR